MKCAATTRSGKKCRNRVSPGSKYCHVHASSSNDQSANTYDGMHDIQNIIKNLREEASEVKRCYTEFDFKALVLATAFFGFMSQFYPGKTDALVSHFLIWLLCAAVIAVLMCIARIGYHKFSTANRNYGYELHLYRTYQYERQYHKTERESRIRNIGWEEAMCAWRVVQPLLFETIYDVSHGPIRSLIPLPVREHRFSNQNHQYHWWNTQHLINNGEDDTAYQEESHFPYHPGRYLRNTQVLIHTLCVAVYAIWTISYFSVCIPVYGLASSLLSDFWLFLSLYIAVWIYLTLHLILSILRQHSRRHILENGFLSIQSCAVVWRLVALAHLKAVDAGFELGTDYRGYTRRLAENANSIKKQLFNIHETIMKDKWGP